MPIEIIYQKNEGEIKVFLDKQKLCESTRFGETFTKRNHKKMYFRRKVIPGRRFEI